MLISFNHRALEVEVRGEHWESLGAKRAYVPGVNPEACSEKKYKFMRPVTSCSAPRQSEASENLGLRESVDRTCPPDVARLTLVVILVLRSSSEA